jgi:hypothetical protein
MHAQEASKQVALVLPVLLSVQVPLASPAAADVAAYFGPDGRASWRAAAGGAPTTLTFEGFANGTVITDQYASDGVTFSQAGAAFFQDGVNSDGWLFRPHHESLGQPSPAEAGVRGNLSELTHAIGLDQFALSGGAVVTLYRNGVELSTTTSPQYYGEAGLDWPFWGVVSSEGFDAFWVRPVQLEPGYPGQYFNNYIVIDTLMLSTVPGPGVVGLAVLASGALAPGGLAPGALSHRASRSRRRHD